MSSFRVRQSSGLLYLSVFAVWAGAVALASKEVPGIVAVASGDPAGSIIVVVFLAWLALMWLVGVWHLANVFFSWIASRTHAPEPAAVRQSPSPPVAILYTTCDDFDPIAFGTCLRQSYENHEVFVCDDGENPEPVRVAVDRVLAAIAHHPPVTIVRRPDRSGFKAGNMNNALRIHGNRFEYFAVVDADEILPTNFLADCISAIAGKPGIGFVQCAHACRETGASAFSARHGIAIAGHWRHFVPAREKFGLLPFYGHGALIRIDAWRRVGGFPEIVSEDLALTVLLRTVGFRGTYLPEVVCEESFPSDFSSLTRRTGKWVRGTLEFFRTCGAPFFASRKVPGVEKIDVAFCALSLLLPLPFILIMLMVAGLYVSNQHAALQDALASLWANPLILALGITAMMAPMAYTLAELPLHGTRVLRQLVLSAATYLAVVPAAAWEAVAYLVTGRASFPTTGSTPERGPRSPRLRHVLVFAVACFLLAASLTAGDLLLFGVALAFLLGQIHLLRPRVPGIVFCLPFVLIMFGIALLPVSLLAVPLAVGTAFTAHQ